MAETEFEDALVVCGTSQGLELRAKLVHHARHGAVFELYSVESSVRTSEVLKDFKIIVQNKTLYSGKAVVKSLLDAGSTILCEVSLEDGWVDVEPSSNGQLTAQFGEFMHHWERNYKVLPEYKVLAADMQTFLTDLRLWVEQLELGIRASPSGDRLERERDLGTELSKSIFPAVDSLFEKYEDLAGRIPEELRPAHRAYIRRVIHPLVLSSPFAFRTVRKPLGYAGDYEVVNMLLRDPHEGPSLFGKVLNRWFIKQPPAEAHRNRISYLTDQLARETARVTTRGDYARIFNLGCGPAKEVQCFLAQEAVSDRAQLTLLDFNEETLAHAKVMIDDAKKRHHRSARVDLIKKSVGQVLKGRTKKVDGAGAGAYDFIYCAGLFDYLSAGICKELMNIFYDMLSPGGLLVATNVDLFNPIRHWLGDILEWHLIYRTSRDFLALRPAVCPTDQVRVVSDITGVNIFLEVRKPL
jgi:extracellular factor (EF) 3-hydroxypalmitic acid methyl ester biosynthesis protein